MGILSSSALTSELIHVYLTRARPCNDLFLIYEPHCVFGDAAVLGGAKFVVKL